MEEKELELGLNEIRKAKAQHPNATSIKWLNGFVEVTYNIYSEEWLSNPF